MKDIRDYRAEKYNSSAYEMQEDGIYKCRDVGSRSHLSGSALRPSAAKQIDVPPQVKARVITMKNKLLVALAMMLAFSMVFAGCGANDVDDDDAMPSTSQDTRPDESASGGAQKEYVELTIEYTVTSEGKAEVTGFSGTGNRATIVSEYEGCKVVGIAASAFENCATLESVLFWADVEEIGDAAFKNCSALVEIGIPNETIHIGNHAFAGCTALEDLLIWGAPDIGDYAFAGCSSIDEISISADTQSVGAHAFEGCTGAKSLIIWGVETIGDYAFAGCTGIEEVSIPHEVISVGAHAFDGCTSLTSVTVWDDNTQFGVNAFMNCPNLADKPIEDDENEVIPSISKPDEEVADSKYDETAPTACENMGHIWIDATCDKPKSCKVCGETEGDAIGHSTRRGTCERCGEYVNNVAYKDGFAVVTYSDTVWMQEKDGFTDVYVMGTITQISKTNDVTIIDSEGKSWTVDVGTACDLSSYMGTECEVYGFSTGGISSQHKTPLINMSNVDNRVVFIDGKELYPEDFESTQQFANKHAGGTSSDGTGVVWIPTDGGTKYHSYAGCSGMHNPEQVTKDEAERAGFGRCGKCW